MVKIDHEYLKQLLESFESSVGPTTDINELSVAGFDFSEDKFIFHMEILSDEFCIESCSGRDLGFERGIDGGVSWGVVPLRLTSRGHEFLDAIRNKEVWSKIKSEFKDASLGTLLRVSKELLEGVIRKKITEILQG
ncbi:DUF2513 domain-containing protein [Aeromonas veronii]|jgi:hypothetical protein|uniref:DUF2513 domain-containing protein n=1 Tax=Aeromonas veronii TaxID=654 RepID=UPI002936EF72|nr:DUF2513 domain-containing protein [Aeromonas veronii]WOE87207.1 DUF2513 domain-containing protein [Aeromonas veronii]